MTDLKMEVYSPLLELLGLLEIQNSVIWERKAFSSGSFSLTSLITDESRTLLIPENIIWIAGDYAGVIEYVQQEVGDTGPYITVKGNDLTGLLERRILWGKYDLNGPVPDLMYRLVDDCCINPTRGDTAARVIPNLALSDAPGGGVTIRTQKTGGSLLEALEELGETYQVAFGVRFNPSVPRMEFWARPGADRSVHQNANEPVFYSTELDDVLSSEYSYNSQDYKNIALVAGEGEGDNRTMVTVTGKVEPEPELPAPATKYTITLSVDPAGGGVASGGGTVEEGKSVTVTATASGGFEFVGWQENGVTISTSVSYTFKASGNRNLTAVFAAIIPVYIVTVNVRPSVGGTVTGGGAYEEGQSVTLTQSEAYGYRFTGWYDTASGMFLGNDPEYTFTPTENISITAKYAEASVYTVSATIAPAGSGTVTGAGTYQEGQTVTIKAEPGESYKFAAWKETKKSRLPEGYTELEYIQSSGTQYIDTGFNPTTKTRLSADIKITDTQSGCVIFGAKDSSYNRERQFFMFSVPSTSRFEANYFYQTEANLIGLSDYRDRGVLSLDKRTLAFNNSSAALNYTHDDVSASYPVFIFAYNLDGTASSKTSMLLYACQISDNGTLARDFVPCTDPTGAAGLYDLVEGKFYVNAGTGAFTAGPEVDSSVTVSEDAEYTFTVDGDRELVAVFEVEKKESRLPEGYQEVKYISNPNLAYIWNFGPGYTPFYNARLEFLIRIPEGATGFNIFGNRFYYYVRKSSGGYDSRGNGYRLHYDPTAKTISVRYGYSSSNTSGLAGAVLSAEAGLMKIVIDCPKAIFKVNDQEVMLSSASAVSNGSSLYVPSIFAISEYDQIKNTSSGSISTSTNHGTSVLEMELYSFKTYNSTADGTGDLIFDYVPCIDPDGVVGIYEMITGNFYTSYVSSKLFTAGPAV